MLLEQPQWTILVVREPHYGRTDVAGGFMGPQIGSRYDQPQLEPFQRQPLRLRAQPPGHAELDQLISASISKTRGDHWASCHTPLHTPLHARPSGTARHRGRHARHEPPTSAQQAAPPALPGPASQHRPAPASVVAANYHQSITSRRC